MDLGHRFARVPSLLAAFFAFASDDVCRSGGRFRIATEVLRLLAVIAAPLVLAAGGVGLFLWQVAAAVARED